MIDIDTDTNEQDSLPRAKEIFRLFTVSGLHVVIIDEKKKPILEPNPNPNPNEMKTFGVQCVLSRIISISFNLRKMGHEGVERWKKTANRLVDHHDEEWDRVETSSGEISLPKTAFRFKIGDDAIHVYIEENDAIYPKYFQGVTDKFKASGLIIRRGVSIAPLPSSFSFKKNKYYEFITESVRGRIRVYEEPDLVDVISSYLRQSDTPIDPGPRQSRPISGSVREFIGCIRQRLWCFGVFPSRASVYEAENDGKLVTIDDFYDDYECWCARIHNAEPMLNFMEDVHFLTKSVTKKVVVGKGLSRSTCYCFLVDKIAESKNRI